MSYDITIEYKNVRVSMRFLGVDFFALDKVFGAMPIKRLSKYCFDKYHNSFRVMSGILRNFAFRNKQYRL